MYLLTYTSRDRFQELGKSPTKVRQKSPSKILLRVFVVGGLCLVVVRRFW